MADALLSEKLQLQSPEDTKGWLVLKEGYLKKSKLAKGLIRSTKLRWFVLKQHPKTLESRLEYYEGKQFRGSCRLDTATILPARKQGAFTVCSRRNDASRTITMQTDADKLNDATAWILALRNAAAAANKQRQASAKAPQGPSLSEKTAMLSIQDESVSETADSAQPAASDPVLVRQGSRQRGGDEIDGNAIDDARWRALRKSQQEDEPSFEDDEDVRLLREMELEEERRQEEERLAFLAEREAQKQATAVSPEPIAQDDADDGELSEDENDWLEEMRQAELEEERRQEAERQEWLAKQAAGKA